MLATVRRAMFLQEREPLWVFCVNGDLIVEGCHLQCLETPNILSRVIRERRGGESGGQVSALLQGDRDWGKKL